MPKIKNYKDFLRRDATLTLDSFESLGKLNNQLWELRTFQEATKNWLNYSDDFKSFVLGNNELVELPKLAALLSEARRAMEEELKETAQPLVLLRNIQKQLSVLFQKSLAGELLPRLADYAWSLEEALYDYSDDDDFDMFYDEDDVSEENARINLGYLQGKPAFLFAKFLLYPKKVTQEDLDMLCSIAHDAEVQQALPPAELQVIVDKSAQLEAAFILSIGVKS